MGISCTRRSAFVTLLLYLVVFSCHLKGSLAKGHHKPPGLGVGPGVGPGGPGGHHKPPGPGGAAHAPPNLGTIFNVMQFGAKPGSIESQSMSFVRAWRAACDFNGIATLQVPLGVFTLAETVFQGPCKSPPLSSVTVQLQGTMKAVGDPSEYSEQAWISFEHINGLTIIGSGTIDGSGPDVWKYNDCHKDPNCAILPASLYFNNVQNAKIKGITSLNSMGFHMHITNSAMFRITGVHINAPPDSPNTDGMHISRSNTIKVVKTVIGTGDDCISIGQGAVNVTATKVTCGPGHGISVGSLGKLPNELDVNGVTVKNCTLVGTKNGLRIKTWPGSSPSRAAGFLFSNIVMDNVQNPIIIDQNYGTHSDKPSLVKISDVIFQDIKGTAATEAAVSLSCSSGAPCENVKLTDINLQPHINTMKLSSTCTNAQVGFLGVQFPPPCLPPPHP